MRVYIILLIGILINTGKVFASKESAPTLAPSLKSVYDCNTQTYLFWVTESYSGPGITGVESITFNFGDGTPEVEVFPNLSGEFDPVSHQFATSGAYTVSADFFRIETSYHETLGRYWFSPSDFGPTSFTVTESGGVYSFIYTGQSFESVGPYDIEYRYTIYFGDGESHIIGYGTDLDYGELITTHEYSSPPETIIATMTSCVRYYEYNELCCDFMYDFRENPCCTNFAPEEGKRYWISGWVEEAHPSQVKNYENAFIEVEFVGSSGIQKKQFWPSGDIIDNWQRIVADFEIPSGTTDLKINLINQSSSVEAYFDDIRVHPFEASMKSYVYDPVTLWLTAELDDNNYATFYEYDHEGQLIRIKKETARGIMTIQESRSSNPKKAN